MSRKFVEGLAFAFGFGVGLVPGYFLIIGIDHYVRSL
jgi:hypothetical protein